MANYYVSATTGNDSNAGTAVGTAVATIGAAENKATSAGDIVYIAPGTYREQVTHGYSGTSGNRIYFIGDPECEKFGNVVEPGVVRITMSDSLDFASTNSGTATGAVIRSNGKDYITWKNVHVDGGTGGVSAYNDLNYSYGFYASEADYMECINCMAQNLYYGFYQMRHMKGCASISCYIHIYLGVRVDSHIGVGGYSFSQSVDVLTNSIGIGMSQNMFYFGDRTINCFGIGASNGAWSSTGDYLINCLQMGMGTAIQSYSDSFSLLASGSYMAMNQYISRNSKTSGIGFGSVYRQWSSTSNQPLDNEGTTDGSKLHHQKPMILWHYNNVRMLAEALKPTLLNDAIRGVGYADVDSYLPDTDIQGNPRYMGFESASVYATAGSHTVSNRDIGPWELSDIQTSGSAPSGSVGQTFKITDEGVMTFPISVSGSTSVTASVGVNHDPGAGVSVKPRLYLRHSHRTQPSSASVSSTFTGTYQSGSALDVCSTTSTLSDKAWGTLTVSASVDINRELEIVLHNQQTGSDSITSFSGLEIE